MPDPLQCSSMSKLPAEGLPLSASACNNSCVFQLMKEFPLLSMFNIHENLLESLLELQNYADVQAVLAKYDGEKHSFEASTALPSPLTCALCVFRYQFTQICNNMLHSSVAQSQGGIRQVSIAFSPPPR